MLTQEKIKQVQKKIKSGVPEGEIKNDLIQEGFSEEEIKEMFKPKPYNMVSWYLFFANVFLGLAIYLLVERQSLLFLLFTGGMFWAYYAEKKRVKKINKNI